MKVKTATINIFGYACVADLMVFDEKDAKEWKHLFDLWKGLKQGLKDYKSREPNLPEGISEVAFCLWSNSARLLSAKGALTTSFDTYNLKTQKAEQVKATSVEEDLTSFGPKSKWDDLYFLDFYNNGKLDGTFNIYKIPKEEIESIKVNKTQSFTDQQKQGRRPRFSIVKKIIKEKNLKPVAENVKVW